MSRASTSILSKIEKLKRGECPIYEPGLDRAHGTQQRRGPPRATPSTRKAAYRDADMIFICVGTPSDEQGHSDLKYVWQAADDIARP
jgi:UDPglucose 6-dehydrogenase